MLEVLTVILVYTTRLNYHIFYYILISGISTIFYLMSFKDNIFIIISFSLKLGLFPFNIWLIEIYKSFNSRELIIWSVLPKITFLLIFKEYYWFFNNKEFLLWNLISIIMMSIYSYKLVVLLIIVVIDKELFMIYYIIHILIISQYVGFKLRNLWYNNIYAYIIFIIWMISLIGIPPFIGFKVKYMILELYYNNILLLLGVILSSIYLIKYANMGNNLTKWNKKIAFISLLLI